MDGVRYFFWLATMAMQLTVYFFPVALLILAGGISATVLFSSLPSDRRRHALAGAVIQPAVPIAILLCGVMLRYDLTRGGPAPKASSWLVEGLVLFHLLLTAALVGRLRGARWFTFAVAVAVFPYSWAAAAISVMSITGMWL